MKDIKRLQLRAMPPEIHSYLIQKQAEIRKTEGLISLERVMYRIIREDMKKTCKIGSSISTLIIDTDF